MLSTSILNILNPIALRKTKIVYYFGLSECSRVKESVYYAGNGNCVPMFFIAQWKLNMVFSDLEKVFDKKPTCFSNATNNNNKSNCHKNLFNEYSLKWCGLRVIAYITSKQLSEDFSLMSWLFH